MSIGRVNTGGGGGSANTFAVIHAIYPEGSTCTCSNGTKTLTAKDTSGLWNFLIPSAGNWTVTATDGTHSTSKTVSITAQGQGEALTLAYETVIFDSVNGLADGYTSTDGDVVIGQDANGKYILFKNGGGYNNMSYLTSPIDMTNFAYLDLYGFSEQTGGTNFGIWKGGVGSDVTPVAVINIPNATTPTTHTVEVFNMTGEHRIGNRYSQGPTKFYKISLRES